ncbi:hypothetical protein JW926_00775 [Candidatus Sumerlaeota bacterium]|nr:hypothetical protein [Candidatus Sumerlaeota bacterium]
MKKIKIRCNGHGRHVNEIDLDTALKRIRVLRSEASPFPDPIPDRIVLPCHECAEGRVILTRNIIKENM